MTAIYFEINNIALDPPTLKITEAHHLLTNIDADIKIYTDDQMLFSEKINFLEFSSDLKKWCESGLKESYAFDSSDFEETGLIQFIFDGKRFKFDSCWSRNTERPLLTYSEIREFSTSFHLASNAAIFDQFELTLSDYGI